MSDKLFDRDKASYSLWQSNAECDANAITLKQILEAVKHAQTPSERPISPKVMEAVLFRRGLK